MASATNELYTHKYKSGCF